MPKKWCCFLFCKRYGKIHLDDNSKKETKLTETKITESAKFERQLSNSINNSFEAHLNKLNNLNIKK
jgi:hypothetical protein